MHELNVIAKYTTSVKSLNIKAKIGNFASESSSTIIIYEKVIEKSVVSNMVK